MKKINCQRLVVKGFNFFYRHYFLTYLTIFLLGILSILIIPFIYNFIEFRLSCRDEIHIMKALKIFPEIEEICQDSTVLRKGDLQSCIFNVKSKFIPKSSWKEVEWNNESKLNFETFKKYFTHRQLIPTRKVYQKDIKNGNKEIKTFYLFPCENNLYYMLTILR